MVSGNRFRLLVLFALAAGCMKRSSSSEVRLDHTIQALDVAWSARAQSGLASMMEEHRIAHEGFPAAPEVQWRMARAEIAMALSERDRTRRIEGFARAREQGWACVMENDQIASLRREVGLAAALRTIPSSRHPCLAWAHLGWARWYAEFGGGPASLDLTELTVLASIGEEMPTPSSRSTSELAALIVNASRPGWARADSTGAEDAILRLVPTDDTGVVLVDWYRFFARGTESEQNARRLLEKTHTKSPEGFAYQGRVLRSSDAK